MAGTLTISTLSDGTNSTSSTNCIQGSAKAWVEYNGVTGTKNASYNVSSVTKNATGDYTINFTNAFSDAYYCAALGIGSQIAGQGRIIMEQHDSVLRSTTQLRIYSLSTLLSPADSNVISVACFR